MFRLRSGVIAIVFVGLTVAFNCGKPDEQKSDQLARVHPALESTTVPTGLGVNIHFYQGNDKDLSMLAESGVGIVRMDVSWGGAEKSPGKYDFSRYDQLISDLEKRHIRLLFIIDYGNPLYDGGDAPHSEEGRKAYARFCAALAKRYAGKDIIWELWNEPNIDKFWRPESNVDDYMAWCKTVVPAIRRADPQACIVAPAVSKIDFSFLAACFKQGLLDLVDGVTVHPYRSPDRYPETALDEYSLLKALIKQNQPQDKIVPILSGEWGYSTTVLSRQKQGKYLPRQWLSNMSAGIPISIWYDWHDDGQDPEEPEHNFGTVTWDYRPKPSFVAMKTLIHELRGFRPLQRIGTGQAGDYLLVFENGATVKLALWTTEEAHTIDLGQALLVSRAVDYLGNSLSVSDGHSLSISDAPMYLTIAEPLPRWLDLVLQAYRLEEATARQYAQALIDNNKNIDSQFIRELQYALASRSKQDQRAAWHVLVLLTQRLQNQQQALTMYHRILQSPADRLDKKMVLTALAMNPSINSIPIVSPLIRDPALSHDAAFYFSQLARKLLQDDDVEGAKKMILVAARGTNLTYLTELVWQEMQAKGIRVDQNALAAQAGFINSWWVVGPFPNENDRGERKSFFPEKNIDFSRTQKFGNTTVRWQKVRPDNSWGIVPLADMFGQVQGVAYVYAELKVPRQQTALFKIGSNDGVVCWLNGRKVHENYAARKLTVDEDVVPVHLEKGINRILLKVPNKGANWEVCLRVSDQKGAPLNLSGKINR